MIDKRSALLGAGAGVGARAVLPHVILLKLRRDVQRLNHGDYRPLLSGYAEDAILHFNEGPHRRARGEAAGARRGTRGGLLSDGLATGR